MPSPSSQSPRLALALLTVIVLWASAFPIIKSAGHAFSPIHLALLRFLAATVTLFLLAASSPMKLPKLRDIPPILLCGLLGISVYHVLLNYGEITVDSGAAALLINSAPIWTALLSIYLLKEKISTIRWVGIFLGFSGVTLIALGSRHGIRLTPGAIAIVAAAFCAALYVITQKKFLSHLPALDFMKWVMLAGMLQLALAAAIFDPHFVKAVLNARTINTLEVLYLGIFPGAIAYLCFAYATQRLPATAVISYMYFIPALAMLIAWFYIPEVPTVFSLVGGVLAILGVILVTRFGQSKKKA